MVVAGCFDLNVLTVFARSFGCCGAADVRTADADYSVVTTTTARTENRNEKPRHHRDVSHLNHLQCGHLRCANPHKDTVYLLNQ